MSLLSNLQDVVQQDWRFCGIGFLVFAGICVASTMLLAE